MGERPSKSDYDNFIIAYKDVNTNEGVKDFLIHLRECSNTGFNNAHALYEYIKAHGDAKEKELAKKVFGDAMQSLANYLTFHQIANDMLGVRLFEDSDAEDSNDVGCEVDQNND